MARRDTSNRSRFWFDPAIAGLSLLHADFTRHDYAPHAHDGLVIAVTEIGGSEFKSRGSVEEASARMLLVFNPDEPHSGRMGRSRHWRYRSFYLHEAAIDAVNAALGNDQWPSFTANSFYDPDLIGAFHTLHLTLDQRYTDRCDGLRTEELLAVSFGRLFRRYSSANQRIELAPLDHTLLNKVVATMRERHTEKLGLATLSATVGLTPFQLIAMFNRLIGLSPHAYLTQIRLRTAIHHMQMRHSIAEAAVASGFYDQSALTKHFKRCFGITPLQYRMASTT